MQGLYTALITPFVADGSKVDEEGLRKNIAFQLENGIDGLLVLGSTGEAAVLAPEERDLVIKIARAETKGKVPLLVGTGCPSTRETLHLTRRAQELGADAAMIITPYYIRPTQEGIYRHFAHIVKECSLPVMIYNNPSRAGTSIELATLQRLAALTGICGIKESSGKVEMVREIGAALPAFTVMSGDDCLAQESLKRGAKGHISVLSNLLPKEMKAYCRGEIDLSPFIKAIGIETNPTPIKAMMQLKGMAAGPTRLPLCELQESSRRHIERLMRGC